MEEIEITIVNWDKYQSKTKATNRSWVKISNDLPFSRSLFGVSLSAKWTFICLLCDKSRELQTACSVSYVTNIKHLSNLCRQRCDRLTTHLQELQDVGCISVKILGSEKARIKRREYKRREEEEKEEKKEENPHPPTASPYPDWLTPKTKTFLETHGVKPSVVASLEMRHQDRSWLEMVLSQAAAINEASPKNDIPDWLVRFCFREWNKYMERVRKNFGALENKERKERGTILSQDELKGLFTGEEI